MLLMLLWLQTAHFQRSSASEITLLFGWRCQILVFFQSFTLVWNGHFSLDKNCDYSEFTQDDHITKVNAVPRWIFTKHLNSPTPFASSSPFFLAILCRIDAFSLNFPEVYYFINKTTNLWSESICVHICIFGVSVFAHYHHWEDRVCESLAGRCCFSWECCGGRRSFLLAGGGV